jgi:hypothetical protein
VPSDHLEPLFAQTHARTHSLAETQQRAAVAESALADNIERTGNELPRLTAQLAASHALYAEATARYHQVCARHGWMDAVNKIQSRWPTRAKIICFHHSTKNKIIRVVG